MRLSTQRIAMLRSGYLDSVLGALSSRKRSKPWMWGNSRNATHRDLTPWSLDKLGEPTIRKLLHAIGAATDCGRMTLALHRRRAFSIEPYSPGCCAEKIGPSSLSSRAPENLKAHTLFPFYETFAVITHGADRIPLPYYETFSVGGHCDAGHIFLHSNRGCAILSGLQVFPAVGEHARYALL